MNRMNFSSVQSRKISSRSSTTSRIWNFLLRSRLSLLRAKTIDCTNSRSNVPKKMVRLRIWKLKFAGRQAWQMRTVRSSSRPKSS